MADTFGPRELSADEIAACAEQRAKNDSDAPLTLGDFVVTDKSVTEASWSAIEAKVAELKAADDAAKGAGQQQGGDQQPQGGAPAQGAAGTDPAPPAPQAPAPTRAPKRQKRIVVDELRDVSVTVVRSTLVFRPGQVLTGHLIDIARENGIQLREV